MNRKNVKVLIIYLFSIIVFACVYLFFWYENTSYFIISEDYNRQTLQPTIFIDELPNDFKHNAEQNISAVNEQISIQYEKLNTLNRRAKNTEDLLTKLNTHSEKLNKELWNSYNSNFADSVKKKTSSTKKRIEEVLALIDYNDKRKSIDDEVTRAVKAADYNVRLAELKLKEFKLISSLYDKGFSNYFDKKLYDQNNLIIDSIQMIYKKKSQFLDSVVKVKILISDLGTGYHSKRLSRLGFGDFIYFSSGVATASSFGDILPNHTTIRIVVFFQILLSVVLFGYFVNSIIEGIHKVL